MRSMGDVGWGCVFASGVKASRRRFVNRGDVVGLCGGRLLGFYRASRSKGAAGLWHNGRTRRGLAKRREDVSRSYGRACRSWEHGRARVDGRRVVWLLVAVMACKVQTCL